MKASVEVSTGSDIDISSPIATEIPNAVVIGTP